MTPRPSDGNGHGAVASTPPAASAASATSSTRPSAPPRPSRYGAGAAARRESSVPDPPAFRRMLLRTVAVPVALVALLAAVLFWQIRQLVEASRWVDSTDRAIAVANRTERLVADAESGLRGYLVTRDAVFLAPYVRATASIGGSFDALAALVAGEADQAARVRELRAAHAAWARYAEQLLHAASGDAARAPGPDVHRVGMALMDGLRARFAEVIAEEVRQRDVRTARSRAAAITTMILALGAVAVLGVAFAILARRQLEALARSYGHALEEERAARREVEAAARLKDEFLGIVSHELRTPLTAILGWVQMLRADVIEPAQRVRALESIQRNANAQARLVEDMLDVSRVISGKLRLRLAAVDVERVVTAALDATRASAEAKEIEVVTAFERGVGAVLGDGDRLQQVVWNLLSNAVKFTPRGGRIRVALGRTDEGESVEIVVADTGAGVRADQLPRVFERFYQGDSSVTRRHGGLGIGLAIARHLVELHGGTITAASDGPGRGATFTVRLPLARAETAPGAAVDGEGDEDEGRVVAPTGVAVHPQSTVECPRELAGLAVLVVDDEPDARELLASVLAHCHARVTVAADVEEALACFERARPDVVVSDIGMPERDGYALIRAIRARAPDDGGEVPAVALTAYASTADRTRALAAGFDIHLAKPVTPQELVVVVASVVARRRRR